MASFWLLVIDHPDERLSATAFDHLHSWFPNMGEALVFKDLFEFRFGNRKRHEVIDASDPEVRCPRCGRTVESLLG